MKKNLIIAAAAVAAMCGAVHALEVGDLTGVTAADLKMEKMDNPVIQVQRVENDKVERQSDLVKLCGFWIKGSRDGWADSGDGKLVGDELGMMIKRSVNRVELIQARLMLSNAAAKAVDMADTETVLLENRKIVLKENIESARKHFPELAGSSDKEVIKFCRDYKGGDVYNAANLLKEWAAVTVAKAYDGIESQRINAETNPKLVEIFNKERALVDARLALVK
jgi:hypothetical protein